MPPRQWLERLRLCVEAGQAVSPLARLQNRAGFGQYSPISLATIHAGSEPH